MPRSSHRLPLHFRPHTAPDGITAIDCILVDPQSRGELNAGQYSVEKPPIGLRVGFHATRANGVTSEPIQRGPASRFLQIYEVSNYTDSPVVAYVWRPA